MEIQTAIKGMLDARESLRSKDGVINPSFISEQMQRLAQYTGAVEEYLAELEEQIELDEYRAYSSYREAGSSVNQAETIAKQDVSALKGQIAKLKRYVNSSWSIIGVAQSRFNHLANDFKLGSKHT